MIHPVINKINQNLSFSCVYKNSTNSLILEKISSLQSLQLLLEVAARNIHTKANCRIALKGGFHGSAHVCIIYHPVHAFWHRPSFSLFMNQS